MIIIIVSRFSDVVPTTDVRPPRKIVQLGAGDSECTSNCRCGQRSCWLVWFSFFLFSFWLFYHVFDSDWMFGRRLVCVCLLSLCVRFVDVQREMCCSAVKCGEWRWSPIFRPLHLYVSSSEEHGMRDRRVWRGACSLWISTIRSRAWSSRSQFLIFHPRCFVCENRESEGEVVLSLLNLAAQF